MPIARRLLPLLIAVVPVVAAAAERLPPQRFVLDRVTEVYGWYDGESGVLTVLTPSGFTESRIDRRRLSAGEQLSDEQARQGLKLKQDQLAAYEAAYAAAEPRRQEERDRRAEAARQAEAERREREERDAAESARLAEEDRQRRRELAETLERIRVQQLEQERVRAEQERAEAERVRADALKQLADAELLRAYQRQRDEERHRDPKHWRFVRTPDDPQGHWERIDPPKDPK